MSLSLVFLLLWSGAVSSNTNIEIQPAFYWQLPAQQDLPTLLRGGFLLSPLADLGKRGFWSASYYYVRTNMKYNALLFAVLAMFVLVCPSCAR